VEAELWNVDATAGAVTVTLPWPALPGHRVTVKKTDPSHNPVAVQAGFEVFTLSLRNQRLNLVKAEGGWDWKVTE
jgi:hypothetical protein